MSLRLCVGAIDKVFENLEEPIHPGSEEGIPKWQRPDLEGHTRSLETRICGESDVLEMVQTSTVAWCDVVSVHGAVLDGPQGEGSHIAVALSEAEHVARQVFGCIDADRLERHRHEVDAEELSQGSEGFSLLKAGEDEAELGCLLGLHEEALVAGEVHLSEEGGSGARRI